MGGYAFYVWSAYAVFVGVLTANLISALRHRRLLLRELSKTASQQTIDDAKT